ncbi:type II secretion system protein J [Bdellovibrio sp. HCB209]|uniref:PulJ/GspJ family protein n=1 Tax=Bdellovibrio sp. HCB209 TaxID=3394354 RepID=UPI0039B59C1E
MMLRILRNQKGMSLAELMVGIGLSAIVISIVVATQVQVTKDQNELIKKLDDSIDQNLAERIIFKDLNGIDIAYNNIVVKDDNGNNFFDYYPDITLNILSGHTDREVTLKLNGAITEFVVVSQNTSAGSLLTYDPTWAYDVGADPGDPNTPASLTFNAAKNRQWISNEASGGRPGFWKDGISLMFDTPSRIRPIVGGSVDMKTPPRSPIFIGSVQANAGDSLVSLDSSVAKMFNLTQPSTGTTITSLDNFLRNVPAVGGGQTIVRLRAVKIAKYYVVKDEKKNANDYKDAPANLMVAEYRNGAFQNPMLLADGVSKMVLRRDSVLKRMIYFKIHKAEKK